MLILICGRPRAGKTTLSTYFKCIVTHADYIQYRGCAIATKRNDKICCEGIFSSIASRNMILNEANGYKTCVWLDTSKDLRQKRLGVKELQHDYYFRPPTLDEGWDKIIIVKDNDYKNAEVILKDSNLKGDLADG